MDSFAWLVVGHGGTVTLLVETSLLVVFAILVAWIWLRERRRRLRKGAQPARMRE